LPLAWRDIAILVNNAGHDGGGRERFDDCETDALASIVETNITGMIRVSKAIIPGALVRGGGDVVNIGSTSGHFALAHDAAYVASKFSINGLTRALRADYEGMGLRVIEVAPGVTAPDLPRFAIMARLPAPKNSMSASPRFWKPTTLRERLSSRWNNRPTSHWAKSSCSLLMVGNRRQVGDSILTGISHLECLRLADPR
jgi:short-subunit dehydrogenase